MEIPKTIKVGNHEINIVELGAHEANAQSIYGEFFFSTLKIQIDTSVSSSHQLETLLHELNHAVYAIYKISKDDNEERIVSTFGMAWAKIFLDNPMLAILIQHWVNDINYSTLEGDNNG